MRKERTTALTNHREDSLLAQFSPLARVSILRSFLCHSGAVTKPDSIGFKVTNIFGSECRGASWLVFCFWGVRGGQPVAFAFIVFAYFGTAFRRGLVLCGWDGCSGGGGDGEAGGRGGGTRLLLCLVV